MRVSAGDRFAKFRLRLKGWRRRITYSTRFTDFIASAATLFIRAYTKTLKTQYYFHPEFLNLDHNKVFFGFWHGRQLLLVPSFGHWHVTLMTDLSWAGEIQTRILTRLGYHVVRGSSKRKGIRALLSMKKEIEKGFSGAFALDGPRGPIYKSKPGILFLAKKFDYPIIPTATSAGRCWILKSTWCHYMLPKPFSRCYISMGRPMRVSSESEEFLSAAFDKHLKVWTAKADIKVG